MLGEEGQDGFGEGGKVCVVGVPMGDGRWESASFVALRREPQAMSEMVTVSRPYIQNEGQSTCTHRGSGGRLRSSTTFSSILLCDGDQVRRPRRGGGVVSQKKRDKKQMSRNTPDTPKKFSPAAQLFIVA